MACMFFISGLFVRDSLARRGPANFLANRAWRLGVPFLVSIFVVMPIAYYPTLLRYHPPGTTDFDFLHFWWHTLTVCLWPAAPRVIEPLGQRISALRGRPLTAFAGFLAFTVILYLPMRLIFGDSSW